MASSSWPWVTANANSPPCSRLLPPAATMLIVALASTSRNAFRSAGDLAGIARICRCMVASPLLLCGARASARPPPQVAHSRAPRPPESIEAGPHRPRATAAAHELRLSRVDPACCQSTASRRGRRRPVGRRRPDRAKEPRETLAEADRIDRARRSARSGQPDHALALGVAHGPRPSSASPARTSSRGDTSSPPLVARLPSSALRTSSASSGRPPSGGSHRRAATPASKIRRGTACLPYGRAAQAGIRSIVSRWRGRSSEKCSDPASPAWTPRVVIARQTA